MYADGEGFGENEKKRTFFYFVVKIVSVVLCLFLFIFNAVLHVSVLVRFCNHLTEEERAGCTLIKL